MSTQIIDDLKQYISDECKPVNVKERYDNMLDECYDLSMIGGPFSCMLASRVLEEMDPTAYRCGMNDYESEEDFVEVGGEYYERKEADKAVDAFRDELESRISDVENELEQEQEEDEPDTDEVNRIEAELSALRAQLKEVEAYSL